MEHHVPAENAALTAAQLKKISLRRDRKHQRQARKHFDLVCAMTHFLLQVRFLQKCGPVGKKRVTWESPTRQCYVFLYTTCPVLRDEVDRAYDRTKIRRQNKKRLQSNKWEWQDFDTPSLPWQFFLENCTYGGQGFAGLNILGECATTGCHELLPVHRGCTACLHEVTNIIPQMFLRATYCDSAIHVARLTGPSLCHKCINEPIPYLTLRIEFWGGQSPYEIERARIIRQEQDRLIEENYNEECHWEGEEPPEERQQEERE